MVDTFQVAAVAVVAAAAAAGLAPWLGAAGILVLAVASVVWIRRPPVPVKTVGWTQMALGLMIVILTAAGARAGL